MKPPLCPCGAQAEYSVLRTSVNSGPAPATPEVWSRESLLCGPYTEAPIGAMDLDASGVQASLRSAYTAIADASGAECDPHLASECAIDREQEVGTNEPEVTRCGRQ